MPAPAGAGLVKDENTGEARLGFLGLGGFWAQSSLDRRTSPTLRGRWVMINLLCTEPPAPPPNVPKLEDLPQAVDLSQGNVAALLTIHREDPACANCHALFDPYGVALENFDGIGRHRTNYANGEAVNSNTQLLDGTQLSDIVGLANYVSASPKYRECIGENLIRYGLGRVVQPSDAPQVEAIQHNWDNGADALSIRRLVESVVLSDAFRFRRSQPAL
jgi:hypothetical protein